MPALDDRSPWPWRLLLVAAALAALLPTAAAAQHCTEEPCGPMDWTPPTITIFPGSGSYPAGALSVQVSWSDDYALSFGTRQLLLDGVDVTSQFSHSNPNNWTSTSTGSVTIGTGSRVLSAAICDHTGYNCSQVQATFTALAPSVRVSADRDSVTVMGNSSQMARFRVVNTGSISATYALTPSCTNTTACYVSGGASPVQLAPGDSAYVDVAYQSPLSGSAQVRLTASAGGASSQGVVHVTALAPQGAGFPGDSLSLTRIERGACFTAAIAPAAASECGDLRVVHPLPGARVLNRARAPVLVYNHEQALPRPIVAEHVSPAAGTQPDSIHAVLTVNGVSYTGRWPAWAAGQTRRIAVSFTATSLPTGVYPYTLQVTARWNGGATQTLRTRSGRMVLVNRSSSPFGQGWWLSGVEQIHHLGDTLKLWVGGDGSARMYRGPGAQGPWVADDFDRPERLVRRDSLYVRTLPGGAEVRFNALGDHVATVSTLGHVTSFLWQSFATDRRRLVGIVLPSAPGAPETLSYTFEYLNNTGSAVPRLSRVVAPAPVGTRATVVATDASGRVERITDPDAHFVDFSYVGAGGIMATRTDRRGSTTTFGFSRQKVHTATRVAGADTMRVLLQAAQGLGLSGSSFHADSVEVTYDGPRTGISDHVRWRVDRWGAPVRVRNEFGAITEIVRGDPRWPARVTQVVAPNGMLSTAAYDARGNVASTTEWSPYGDARHATTTYEWHPVWDAVRRVTLPEGEVTEIHYDNYGRRQWEQVGPSSTRRVNYTYLPTSHATAPGLPHQVFLPGGGWETFEYDARGNLSATVSPLGARSEFESDRLGRVTVSRTAIDTVAGVVRFQGDSTQYHPANDRPLRVASFGPAMNGVAAQRVIVENDYDPEGNLLSLSRVSAPDPNGIGTVTTRWVYDAVGRPILELAPDATPGNPNDNPRDSTVYDKAGNVVEVHTRRWDDAGQRVVVRMDYDVGNRLIRRRTGAVQYHARNQGIAQRGFIRAWEHEVQVNGVPPYPWYPNDGGTGYRIPADTAHFVYDAVGNLLRADNRDAWIRRSYYPNGALKGDTLKVRTLAELAAGGDSTSHVYGLLHVYDRNGRRTGLQHPVTVAPRLAGVLKDWTTWSYDRPTGALSTVTDPLGNQFRYHFDARGQVDSLYHPGGITDVFQYDLDGRMIRHWTLNANTVGADRYTAPVLRDETFRYDARGKMTFSGNAVLARDTTKVWYSGLGHMVADTVKSKGALINNVIPASTMTQVVGHDALGHRGTAITGSSFRIEGYFQTQSSASTQRYQFGTGRQRAYQDNFRIDTLHYDGGGNQLFSTTSATVPSAAELRDAAYFYGADGKLRAADVRNIADHTNTMSYYSRSFEEYRYDALGRRVLVRLRRDCAQSDRSALCEMGFVRRTVWDGDRELYEIQAWGGWFGLEGSWVEADTARPRIPTWSGHPMGATNVDPNPFLGRVVYTHGLSLDQPLGVVRMGYTSRLNSQNQTSTTRDFEPVAIVPFWNMRGQPGLGAFADGTWRKCMPDAHCVNLAWPEMWAGYARPKWERSWWHGTLLEDKADASGLNFRRNRYYDPVNGRFTQEDPIGLAGGLNVYGFAAGDPVNYGDPYGLCPGSNSAESALAYYADAANSGRGLRRGLAIAGGLFSALWTKDNCVETALALGPEFAIAAGSRAIAGYRVLRGGNAAHNAADGVRLWKQLASQELLGEAQAGIGIAIAGAGARTGRQIDDIGRLVDQYGGTAADWAKMSTRERRASDGTKVSVHWYENVRTGQRVEFKQNL